MPEVRKLVTILFADVTGSTALGEALDPEDVRWTSMAFWRCAAPAIHSQQECIARDPSRHP
jgi:class 3 adenylate cyclase